MSEKRFMCMFLLVTFAGLVALVSPAAAISPALMVLVLGFDGVCDAIAIETRRAETTGSAAKP